MVDLVRLVSALGYTEWAKREWTGGVRGRMAWVGVKVFTLPGLEQSDTLSLVNVTISVARHGRASDSGGVQLAARRLAPLDAALTPWMADGRGQARQPDEDSSTPPMSAAP